jgi:hypothetical protein
VRRRLFSILVLVAAASRVEAGCIDPAMQAHSTVSIMRHFDDKEQEEQPGVLGIRGTGWFLSPTSMVTVEHVAAAMKLSDRTWKQVEIGTGESKQSVPVRIQRLAGSSEKIAVLELQTAFSGAQGFRLRMEPLAPEEPVVSLAYPGGRLRVVTATATSSQARRCSRCTTEMTASCSITVPRERPWSIARAEWSRW